MNWRHLAGAFFLLVATVLVLNISPFIHLSVHQQVIFVIKMISIINKIHQSDQPINTRPATLEKEKYFCLPAKVFLNLNLSQTHLGLLLLVCSRHILISSRWQVLKNVFRVLKVNFSFFPSQIETLLFVMIHFDETKKTNLKLLK